MQEFNMNNYPKILIFGQPFNTYSGGGITLTNLFRGWPKDRIAVASTGHVLYKENSGGYFLLTLCKDLSLQARSHLKRIRVRKKARIS